MEFRLLGPFETVHGGGTVRVGGRRQERCLLSILLLEADRPVTTERLADLLWNGDPPDSARGTVQTYVGRLRRALDVYGVVIETRGDSYLLHREEHTTDVERFTALARDARLAPEAGARIGLLDTALALWRGPLLSDVADDALRRRLEPALVETRLSAVEARAEACLDVGHVDRVVADLGPLVEEYPTRERLVEKLMTALYRGGRPADALAHYRRTRAYLVDELGIEPGRDLRELHGRILRADPGLVRRRIPVYAVAVDDKLLPRPFSGHPALEFCNTFAGWPSAGGCDWLKDYATLAVWAGYQDLLDQGTVAALRAQASAAPAEAAAALSEARRLRHHLYKVLTDPADRSAFRVAAGAAEEAMRRSVFRLGEDGLGQWRVAPDAGLRAPALAVARVAAELLADPRRLLICACTAPNCGWLFLDRGGARRFCASGTCGEPARLRAG